MEGRAGIANEQFFLPICRILTVRFNLVRPYSAGIIDAKFDLSCVKSDSLQTPLQCGMQLSLVRKEVANVTHGALLQHVIDEKSPLFMLDIEVRNLLCLHQLSTWYCLSFQFNSTSGNVAPSVIFFLSHLIVLLCRAFGRKTLSSVLLSEPSTRIQ